MNRHFTGSIIVEDIHLDTSTSQSYKVVFVSVREIQVFRKR